MDDVRASIARALGQPGCRARVLVGTSGEISGPAPFRAAPEIRAAGAGAALTVVGYARVKKKDARGAPGSALGTSTAHARAANANGEAAARDASDAADAAAATRARGAPASPGHRRRNYIRETEDEEDGIFQHAMCDPLADPLAAPVGGYVRRGSRARALARADGVADGGGARRAPAGGARRLESLSRRTERDAAPSAPSAGDTMWAVLRDEAAAAAVASTAGRLEDPVQATEADLSRVEAKEPRAPNARPETARRPKDARRARRDGVDVDPRASASTRAPSDTVNTVNAVNTVNTVDRRLPPCLERLAKAYDATSAVACFLRAQRVRSTWGQIEPAARGAATLEDLTAAARLCPRALRLARRAVVPSAEAAEGARGGERPGADAPEERDTLVEVFDAGARARGDAEDEPFGGALDETLDAPAGDPAATSPARRVVVHGSRTSRATYAVGDAPERADAAASRATRRAKPEPRDDASAGARRVPGEAFAKRASAAFRAALGKVVLARVDAWIDIEGMRADDAWDRAMRAGLETFAARAATETELANGNVAPEGRAAAPRSARRAGARDVSKKRRRGAGGGGRRVCERCDALDVEAFIEHLTSGPDALGARGASARSRADGEGEEEGASAKTKTKPGRSGGCVEHRRDEPARAARFGASMVDVLSPATVRALAATGVRADALFSHQSRAISASLRGESVVVATGTASGKSACYNAPAFEALFADPDATALYLFPTKALARDQVGKIRKMLAGAAGTSAETSGEHPRSADQSYHPFEVGAYDGDTPEDERARIFAECRLLVTNPDTLHVSLLPRHGAWRAFFAGLAVVVLDEAHVYRGVFGSHVALVLRRLRRVCREVHGVDPAFVVTSATIGEPLRHAVDLVGGFLRLTPATTTRVEQAAGSAAEGGARTIDARAMADESACPTPGWTAATMDGSPRGAKTFLMWNPPRKDALDGAARAASSGRRKGRKGELGDSPRGKRAVAEKTRAAAARAAAVARATANGPPEGRAFCPEDAKNDSRVGGSDGVRNRPTSDGSDGPDANSRRVSPIVEMAHLLVECVRHDLRVIAFCKTKKLCELVLRYARELLVDSGGAQFLPTLRAYRGGYTAGDRRATESALFDGALRAVAATNALELGVDVGVLDATLHLGFPGSCSSLTQQAGRAGRRGRRALGIYVAFDGPLDQYFMRRPEKLFEAAEAERAAIDCANPAILAAHIACAAYELPLDPRPEGVDARTYFFTSARGDEAGAHEAQSAFREAADALVRDARLARDPRVAARGTGDLRLRWVGDSRGPARGVSVRTIESERYRVVDEATGKTVEEIEASKAFWSVHPGAVYLNQARTFLVKSLDVENRVARVRRADVKYFTKSVDTTRLTLVDHSGSRAAYPDRPRARAGACSSRTANGASSAQTAGCEVAIRFTGFKKVHQGTGACFDEVCFSRDLHVTLPPVTFRTVASWVRIPESARSIVNALGIDFDEAAHAASHALVNALPLKLLASHADVAAECFAARPGTYAPRRLLLYDRHPGGVGIARRAAPVFLELMKLALERVEACDCGVSTEAALGPPSEADARLPVTAAPPRRSGCPGCTHYASCDHYNDGLDKRGAVVVLRETIRVEEQRLRGLERREGEDASRCRGAADASSE